MSRFPQPARRARSVAASPFDVLSPRIAELGAQGLLYPFHIGDSFLLPAEPARRIDLDAEPVHRYCPVQGLPEYRAGVASWLGRQLGADISERQTFAAPGCTGALSVVAASLFDEGDEVIVITPSWPLIFGILRSQGVVPVEVAIGPAGWPEPDEASFLEELRRGCSERTVGIYFCDPNNPVGFVYPSNHLRALARVAAEHDLWLVADVVYKDLILDSVGWQIPGMAQDPEVARRLVIAGTFSKGHLLAGHRAGFIVAPEELASIVARVLTHSSYHASTSAQQMALAALSVGEPELERVRAAYNEGRGAACRSLRARFRRPQAGAFVFLDLREATDDDSQIMDLLVDCLEAGVALAPGAVFGADWTRWARLCYTAAPVERTVEGIERLNRVLQRWAG